MGTEKISDLPQLKLVEDDFEVEFEFELLKNSSDHQEEFKSRNRKIEIGLEDVTKDLELNVQEVKNFNTEISRLTNTADKADYLVAVLSGILAGLIDSIWVGEFSLVRGKDWSNDKVNSFVKKVAQMQGYEGNDLEGSIRHLERKFPLSSDSNTPEFGGGLQHHLRDFAHHPTIIGLIFSMLTQFTGKSYGTATDGSFMIVEVKNKTFIGKELPEKIMFGAVFWFFHLVSDIAGSSSTPGSGTGLPGPLLSLAKEISALPFFKNTAIRDNSLSVWISKLFNGTFFVERDKNGRIIKESVKRFDFRAELGVAYEIGRQGVPVLLNECLVRGFYFVRRLKAQIETNEIKTFKDLKKIEWKKTLPFKNRTIVRMLTIATGTFTTVDLVDAAVRGAIKSKGNKALFAKEFLLRVNFVGAGRFSIAVGTDIAMGFHKEKKRNERIILMSQQMHLMNTKVFYLQANMWKSAESTAETIEEAQMVLEKTVLNTVEVWKANRMSMDNIIKDIDSVRNHNENVINEITEILKWG